MTDHSATDRRRTTRRALLGGVGAGIAALSGCLGPLTGDEPLAFSASPATVSGDAQSKAGYSLAEQRSPVVERDFTVAGQTRTVKVTNEVAMYEKAVDLGPLGSQKAGVFAAVTTPKIEVAGQTFNPVGEMSTRELIAQFQSRYTDLSVGDNVGTDQVATLGTAAKVEQFEASATFKNTQVPIYLHVARFAHGDDFVVALGAYPRRLPNGKADVLAMVGGLQH